MTADVDVAVAQAFQEEWGHLVATLIKVTGSFDVAEESVQDAFAQAVKTWPRDGIPDRPAAWLVTTARNRATDRLRRDAVGAAKLRERVLILDERPTVEDDDSGVGDNLLRLIFTCCHPALALESQVALTLRTLVGLTAAEIAKAFLVSEQTMAKRLFRAKQKIQHAGIPYRVPAAHLLPERTSAVLAVLYLLFNEGYLGGAGAGLLRRDLSDEAIRLARLLAELMPDEPEAKGLLALMLLHDARRAARVDGEGELVLLTDQDRRLWDSKLISEGVAVLDLALRRGRPGAYQVQAAIAACHATAPVAADTDWAQIVELYGQLTRFVPSPVVELNRAVAVSMAVGPGAALPLVDALEKSSALTGYYLLPATRADLLRRLDRPAEASAAYRVALELATGEPERRFLRRRIGELSAAG
jgi:RNA polymerase sigma-70 factor (ECF subfamily)